MMNIDKYFDRLHIELEKDTDRSVAIVAAALVDDVLKELLARKLLPHKDKENCIFSKPGSPIGSFSSRINAAYQLGLISSLMYRDLQLLRKIRNEFAHEPFALSFDDPSIKSKVIELDKKSDYINRNSEARHNIGGKGTRIDFIFLVGWRLYALTRAIEDIEIVQEKPPEFGYIDLGS
ncbi:hypothetical protein Nit79A3_1228 [Nitrosomonas sp. Is79A3]|uniref:MltR family transcriptional regulator n=1 Tax=Nitrosomonas sp. (strain Is79A3) TaxID=261292 RepID=UPI000215CC35